MNSTLLGTAQQLTWLLGLGVAALCGLAWGTQGLVSAVVGVGLSSGNLWVIRRLASRAVHAVEAASGSNENAGGAAGALLGGMFAKMLGLFAAVWIATRLFGLSIIPFTLGLFVFVVALLSAGLWSGLKDTRGAV